MSFATSIAICLGSLIAIVYVVRGRAPSFGLPVAYVFQLLLLHLPGAVAHAMPWAEFPFSEFTQKGIELTAIGAACFVLGVVLARRGGVGKTRSAKWPGSKFLWFCVFGGWIVTFILYPVLIRIPTLGALVDNGCKVWMIGVMLALPAFVERGKVGLALVWLSVMMLYTGWILVNGGFLAHGMRANVIALAPLVVMTGRVWRVWGALGLAVYLGMSVFVSYFLIRDDIRDKVWGGSVLEDRVNESLRIVTEFQMIDLRDRDHLAALDARLNQNYFAGLAAERLRDGAVEHLKGQSVVDGVLMLVPRAIWPNKPLEGGSPKIVAQMTGLRLNENTSWGVGNVMEFYINFGYVTLVGGFVLLGFVLGKLDYLAAKAFQESDYQRLIWCVLPAIALIQPGNSIVEQVGGVAAASLAAYFWCSLWRFIVEKAGKVR